MSETSDTPANSYKQEISSQVSKYPSSLQTVLILPRNVKQFQNAQA